MKTYSFNGMQLAGSVIGIDGVGELRVGGDRFRAIYNPADAVTKAELEVNLPFRATFSNLRGDDNRVRARGEIDTVVEVSDESVVVEGPLKSFSLEPPG